MARGSRLGVGRARKRAFVARAKFLLQRLLALCLAAVLVWGPVLQGVAFAAEADALRERLQSVAPVGADDEARHDARAAAPAPRTIVGQRALTVPVPDAASDVPLLATPLLPIAINDEARDGNEGWLLFDGRAETALSSKTGEPVRLRLTLPGEQALDEITVFGGGQG